jgi:subtilisin family serine protease
MINQDNSPQAGELSPNGAGTTHGSMVAGVAAASGNNSVGIAGVDWATKILPIQALDDDDYGDTFTVGKAIYYAIEQRADVINISLGTMSNDTYVRQAIEAATAAGILVVASSGNDGCECVAYPARYPEVLAVGATDQSNVITYFSSWGSSVDLVAPGTNYTVPSWSQANPTDRYVSGVAGTSFSSPLVAGIATRLKSLQPQASPLHLIAALRETATRTPPADIAHYGFGRADAAVASGRMTESNHSSISYNFTPVFAGTYFGGGSLEKPVDYSAVHCQNVATSTRIYEAIKGSERFYTISEVEKRKAESLGFTVPVFAQVCLEQPHDTKDTVRHLNIFREFRNLNTHL